MGGPIWRVGERAFDCSERTLVMGILNVTPDSFSDGGRFLDRATAVAHATRMVEDGADILDVGGESTRPGSDAVSVDEELERVRPVIERLAELHPGDPDLDRHAEGGRRGRGPGRRRHDRERRVGRRRSGDVRRRPERTRPPSS